jgi:hypothetical protein
VHAWSMEHRPHAGGCGVIVGGSPVSTGLKKPAIAVRNTRRLGKRDMKLNDATPNITVDPETYRVEADGEWLTCEPAQWLPPTTSIRVRTPISSFAPARWPPKGS